MRPRSAWNAAAPVLVIAVAALGICVWQIERLRWRAQVLLLSVEGRIPDLPVGDALRMIEPGSKYWLEGLTVTHNAYASIVNPYGSPHDVDAGAALFRLNCARCHGADARGGRGVPALVGRSLTHGDSDWALYRTIRNGVPGTVMPAHLWRASSVWQVVAFIRSLGANTAPGGAAVATLNVEVPFSELAATDAPADDWLSFSGAYSGRRHSTLAQIRPDNVARLAPRWIHQLGRGGDTSEVSPLERRGVMYVADPDRVLALDARDGRKLWEYVRPVPPGVRLCCIRATRGLAILGDRLFFGTLDAHLIALSANTGKVLWDRVVADYTRDYSITGAPLAYRDLVVTGVAGGDFPTRGFIAAFDAETGAERWRFWTIPGPGESGHESWAGDSWRHGGGATWLTGSYDAQRDVLYWGVGNPAPAYDASARRGDNLYTDSVVALRGSTGEKLWYFQFTPGDDLNWDSEQIPVIVDRGRSSSAHELLLANRNGFFYVLDRATGRFILGSPLVPQTWARGLTAAGRPLRIAGPSSHGTLIYPGKWGATNWFPPSYDPELDLLFVPVLEHGDVFFTSPGAQPREGEQYMGGTAVIGPGSGYAAVVAIRPADGSRAWEHRQSSSWREPRAAGLLSTRGGLVFGATDQTFFALDSSSGRQLWSFPTGGTVLAAPVTYAVEGTQYVAVAAGQAVIAFALVEHVDAARP